MWDMSAKGARDLLAVRGVYVGLPAAEIAAGFTQG
jgi:hypothetical protein